MVPSFFKKLGPISSEVIESSINCKTVNLSKDDYFDSFVSIDNVSNNALSFLYDNEKLVDDFPLNSGIICTEKIANRLNPDQKKFIVSDVQESVAKISNIFYRDYTEKEKLNFGDPVFGKNCEIGNNVTIENGVIIGKNVKINHGAVVKINCIISDGSIIGSNTVISNSILGENIYIGSNTSIGQRGFGFFLSKNNIDIYHIGRVLVQSNVSIGSNCTVDRGSFSDTVIGENTYLDNLCHVAHNVEIGNNSAFAAMTGIAGSAKIGNHVLTGGQAGIAGHIKIGNNVHIAAKSGVFQSIGDGETVMGNPAINKYKFIKNYKKIYGKK
jgi:UDP-3-O-[3-hydroxymyristoyl] glucosamine N-acyltransferase